MGAILIQFGTATFNAYHGPTGYVDIPARCFFGGETQGFQFEYNFGMITVLLTFLFFSNIKGGCQTFQPTF